MPELRALVIVLGDQLDRRSSAFDDFDPSCDAVWMAEAADESTHVWSAKPRIAVFLAAMRHFAADLRRDGAPLHYRELGEPAAAASLAAGLQADIARLAPQRLVLRAPGDWRVYQSIREVAAQAGLALDVREDRQFFSAVREFAAHAKGRKTLRLEYFYREMRQRHEVLMDDGEPAGGRWNYDPENRKPLPKSIQPPAVRAFPPDATTREVMALVAERFPDHFGAVDGFAMPVTAEAARQALDDFIGARLAQFGDWQDTMKTGESTMFHALISTSLNTGLLDPLTACRAAEAAWRDGRAPLNAVEGFIRQILGWREYVRGVYWLKVPEYRHANGLGATRRMPWFYWTGQTRMNCLHHAITDTKRHAYAHHIQRLMVTGNFALLAGLHPDDVDEWYLIVYADAYEWVEMPNVRGMALHADGGIMGSKPYASSGAYINRMSDYCRGCAYDVKQSVGEGACPFNALYWDFIARHRDRFAPNPRMAMPVRSWDKMTEVKQAALRASAAAFLARMDAGDDV